MKIPDFIKRKVQRRDPNFYGGDKTIHSTDYLDVETHDGKVVSVWFRCSMLPFQQTEVGTRRARQMLNMEATRPIEGIQFREES